MKMGILNKLFKKEVVSQENSDEKPEQTLKQHKVSQSEVKARQPTSKTKKQGPKSSKKTENKRPKSKKQPSTTVKRININNARNSKVLAAKNPEEYIRLTMDSNLSQGEKTALTREWLKQNTKFTSADISYARNRHPYWMNLKKKGSQERNKKRREMYMANSGRRRWDEKDCKFMVENNSMRDFELAQNLNRSIAAIQSKRRQINALVKFYEHQGKKIRKDILIRELQKSESSMVKKIRKEIGARPRDGIKKYQ